MAYKQQSPQDVSEGGTGASTLTDHGVLLGSGTSAVTPTAVGTDGQVLIGATAADPAFATLTSSGGTIAFTPGANTLNLETVGGGDVSGPGSSTDNALARWDGPGGDTLQDSTVLVSDTGEMTNASQPAFLAYVSTTDSNVTGDGTSFTIGSGNALTEVFDQGGDFVTTGTFTAPVTGKYFLNYQVDLDQAASNNTSGSMAIVTSNNTFTSNFNPFNFQNTSNDESGTSISVLCDMDASDTATYTIVVAGGSAVVDVVAGATRRTWVSGNLVC